MSHWISKRERKKLLKCFENLGNRSMAGTVPQNKRGHNSLIPFKIVGQGGKLLQKNIYIIDEWMLNCLCHSLLNCAKNSWLQMKMCWCCAIHNGNESANDLRFRNWGPCLANWKIFFFFSFQMVRWSSKTKQFEKDMPKSWGHFCFEIWKWEMRDKLVLRMSSWVVRVRNLASRNSD